MPFRCSSHRIFSSTRVSAWKMSGSLGRKGKDVFDSMCWKFISDSDTWIFVRFIQHLYCGGQLPSAHVTVTKNGANRASRASKWSYQWHGNRTRIEFDVIYSSIYQSTNTQIDTISIFDTSKRFAHYQPKNTGVLGKTWSKRFRISPHISLYRGVFAFFIRRTFQYAIIQYFSCRRQLLHLTEGLGLRMRERRQTHIKGASTL